VIDESDLQDEKQFDPKISTLLWIKIDWSDESQNTNESIRVKHEFDSNVIDESMWQPEKHSEPRISTLIGIKIDWSDDSRNAADSIPIKREFDSNVIDESDLQLEKHSEPRISTFRGIKIDWSDEYEKASDSIRLKHESDSNTIDLSAPCFFREPKEPVGRGQFRMTIESGIQVRKISVSLNEQCVMVLIEPLLTTTRRS
jgi:hypothetical protein